MTRRPELARIQFLDEPPNYPPVRSASSMVIPLPERLRVALHRTAQGVYDILDATEHPQEDLWMVVEYQRVGSAHDGRYRLAPTP